MKKIILIIFVFLFIGCDLQEIVNPPPPTYELKQNFPNPFTDSTVILYGIPATQGSLGPSIKLVVKDRFNQLYSTLVDATNHPAGRDFRVVWYGRGLNYQKAPAGIYYIELEVNEKEIVKRIVALKQ